MSIVIGLTPELSGRSLDVVRTMLWESGLSVSGSADIIPSAEPVRPVLTRLVRETQEYDVVVVTLRDPRRWSDTLDGFFGPDFRLLACTAEPSRENLDFSMTDFVVHTDGGAQSGLEYAVTALVGAADLRPTRYEHALFLAEGQASRSAGLRGRVGCALLDEVGDVIALGANEVPRAGGGQYWADSPDDARDLHGGVDPARESKTTIVRAALEYAQKQRGAPLGNLASLASQFLDQLDEGGGQAGRPSHDSAAQALESLGRVVHAELAALASAARHGASIVGSEAVVTRPPCRQCLRQLIVTGVSSVRFLGHADAAHYPFHADAITSDRGVTDKTMVVPFSGVTPRGYDKVFGDRRIPSLTLGSALGRWARVPASSPMSPLEEAPGSSGDVDVELATLLGALMGPG
jgi:deoxycytidylate deaminase